MARWAYQREVADVARSARPQRLGMVHLPAQPGAAPVPRGSFLCDFPTAYRAPPALPLDHALPLLAVLPAVAIGAPRLCLQPLPVVGAVGRARSPRPRLRVRCELGARSAWHQAGYPQSFGHKIVLKIERGLGQGSKPNPLGGRYGRAGSRPPLSPMIAAASLEALAEVTWIFDPAPPCPCGSGP